MKTEFTDNYLLLIRCNVTNFILRKDMAYLDGDDDDSLTF
jgi:hypothetical protein